MFYFDKKIYYIDYYENGNRISNAGFISLTFKDEDCHVHVGIRNLPGVENRLCRWFGLINSEQVFLEEFRVEKGEADFINCYKRNSLGRTEVDFSALEGFYFALGKRRWGSCFFRNIKQRMEPTFQEKPVKQTVRDVSYNSNSNGNAESVPYPDQDEDNPLSGYSGEMNGNMESDFYDGGLNGNTESELYSEGLNGNTESKQYGDALNGHTGTDLFTVGLDGNTESDFYVGKMNGNTESELYVGEMNGNAKTDLHSSEMTDHTEPKYASQKDTGNSPVGNKSVHRTTWEELTETHQLVHPFEDQGDYISINPFTLKLLAPEYRKLANNSFLLHGFYNYRHLILGYYQDDERQGYYIGVPGTFDEREQMVAEMFGFEGYEPAGGVGYYMRKVEF